MRFFRPGLIARIALLTVCVEVIVIGLVGAYYVDRFSGDIDKAIRSRMQMVGEMIASDELPVSTISQKSVMSDLVGAPYLKGIIIGGSGRVIVSTNTAYLGRIPNIIPGFDARWLADSAPEAAFKIGDDTLTSIIRVHGPSGEAPLYSTVITISTAELNARKHDIIFRGQIGSLFFILLTTIGIVLIAQRLIARRVNSSLTVLNKVADGDTDARISVSYNDELGRLQHGINAMSEKVGQLLEEHRRNEAELRIAAIAFESHEGMMITDTNSVILQVNHTLVADSGYSEDEIVGQTPRLFKSGRHGPEFYRAMWETIHRTGSWQGEIWDRRKNGEIYPKWLTITAVKGSDGVVTNYVGAHIDISERKSAEKEIQLLAYYDPLTQLPNRRLLMNRLQQALASSQRSGQEGALLLIDLDNFKILNDTLGHQIGDLLLQEVSQRLKSCVRDGDTVARLGGDEFVVVLENLGGHAFGAATMAETVGEKIMAALSQPYQLAEYEHQSTTSIGATLFQDHHDEIDELLKQADIAMYQAKKAGRNSLHFFDPQMQASINTRLSLEGELRKALEKQQFELYYQPQVEEGSLLVGAEVLLRWNHPERGMVSPDQFIPLAEETGLILSIGQWVLDTACARIKAWQQDESTRELVLAVNVSAKQLHQADFAAQVQDVIQRHDINPRLLKLELTEGMLLEDVEHTKDTMNALNEIGVQFSLDDFGTGYSSLQYLKQLPFNQIKIDQSFIRDIIADNNDLAIVRTIIAVAHSLNMDVIAEGVETKEQVQLLLKHGCTNYQGYLFGKPVPVEQFKVLLKKA